MVTAKKSARKKLANQRNQPATSRIAAGDLVAVPLPAGRAALVWIIMIDEDRSVKFLVMDGFWNALPTAREAAKARAARGDEHDRLLGYDDVWKGWFRGAVPADFQVVGRRAPSTRELRYARNESGTMVFGTAKRLRDELHRTWRLKYERKAIMSEWAAEEAAEQKRIAERRKAMTLPKLLGDRTFGRDWDWPAPALREMRAIFRTATEALIALEKTGTKRDRVKVLKQVTTDLNALDEPRGVIESVERDLLVERISEIAALVGLTNDDEQLTGHRDF